MEALRYGVAHYSVGPTARSVWWGQRQISAVIDDGRSLKGRGNRCVEMRGESNYDKRVWEMVIELELGVKGFLHRALKVFMLCERKPFIITWNYKSFP